MSCEDGSILPKSPSPREHVTYILFQILGNNVVKEWMFHQKNSITCPVVFDKKSKKYIAVTDHSVITNNEIN